MKKDKGMSSTKFRMAVVPEGKQREDEDYYMCILFMFLQGCYIL